MEEACVDLGNSFDVDTDVDRDSTEARDDDALLDMLDGEKMGVAENACEVIWDALKLSDADIDKKSSEARDEDRPLDTIGDGRTDVDEKTSEDV